jgi:hypothetical protein
MHQQNQEPENRYLLNHTESTMLETNVATPAANDFELAVPFVDPKNVAFLK